MKKRYLVINLILSLIVIGLIPLDLLIISVPTWAAIGLIALDFVLYVVFYLKACASRSAKIITSLITLFAICLSLCGICCNPYWNSYSFKTSAYSTRDYDTVISYREAKEDIDYVVRYVIKDHPLFLKRTPDNFQAEYQKATSELRSCKQITVSKLWHTTQYILSTLNDGHTCAYDRYENPHYLKYIAKMRDDKYTLEAVNGIPLKDLFQSSSNLFSYEAESWGMDLLNQYLCSLEGLDFLGIPINGGVKYTYKNDNGDVIDKTCYAEDFITYEEYVKYNHLEVKDNADRSFVSYSLDTSKSLAVLTLTSCNYNDEYRKCLREMFSEVKDKGIKNVVVDLRDNGGGNSYVADEFITYLDIDRYNIDTSKWRFGFLYLHLHKQIKENRKNTPLTFKGNVYLLTSVSTFSSAMEFAEYIKDNHLGTIIGEAPGNSANGYGEIAIFQMPNSKLYFQVSTEHFVRASGTVEKWITPDIPCDSGDAMDVLYDEVKNTY